MIEWGVDLDLYEYARWFVLDTLKQLLGVVGVYAVLLGAYWGGVGVF